MRKRRYAIIGTGAVGGFYGARLARAGLDVHFLLHSDYEHVRRHGLAIESVEGDFTLPRVQAYAHAAEMPRADVVVLALKTTRNNLLGELLAGVTDDDGVVLVLQNGLGMEEQAAAVVGPDRVMGGLCFLCCNKTAPGCIRHLDYGFVTLAEFSADGAARGTTDRMRAVGADFEAAGIEIRMADDLLLARWRKLVWNVPFNGLSVLLDARVDELMTNPASRLLVEETMVEIADAAGSCGKTIERDFVDYMLGLSEKMKPYRTSMKIDHDLGRPMEVEAIVGNPLRTARRHGAAVPRLDMLYRTLQFLDTRPSTRPANETP